MFLALVGVGVRTFVGVASGSTFVDVAQPIATTFALAYLLRTSFTMGHPIVARIAHNLHPMSSGLVARPSVQRLFTRPPAVWPVAQLPTAGVTVALPIGLAPDLYALLKPAESPPISELAVLVTIRWSCQVAWGEELVLITG